jgi:lipoyl(octanoyl) transferase
MSVSSQPTLLQIRQLGRQPYVPIWQAMQRFTDARDADTPDELWLCEHDPVYTQGQAGKPEHLLNAGSIPVVQCDRGGQVTYHGPGQMMAYALIDLRRKSIGVRDFVSALENATIAALQSYAITAHAKPDAPGVYVGAEKIMALGIRVRRARTFHGLALNVCMDLAPFAGINPCGYTDLRHTSVYDEGGPADLAVMAQALVHYLAIALNSVASWQSELPNVLQVRE